MTDDRLRRTISRRALLRGVGAAAAAGAVGILVEPGAVSTPTAIPSRSIIARVIYEQLTVDEAELLELIADHLIPEDQYGPGAVAAGAIVYIDRALGGALAGSHDVYRRGLAAFERYSRSSYGAPFRELSHADQVSILTNIENSLATEAGASFPDSSDAFFDMVRGHVLQGTFGDPYYGGNQNFVGWDLIKYPGVRTAVSPGLQDALESGELQPNHRSAYDSDGFDKAIVSKARRRTSNGD